MSKINTRATINANIKQNGNQEITGQILNSVLNTMVDDYAEQEKLTELESHISIFGRDLGEDISKFSIKGAYWKTNQGIGNMANIEPTIDQYSGEYECLKIRVRKGDRCLISMKGGTSPLAWCLTDNNYQIIRTSAPSAEYIDYEIEVENEGYLIVNNNIQLASIPLKVVFLSDSEKAIEQIKRESTEFIDTIYTPQVVCYRENVTSISIPCVIQKGKLVSFKISNITGEYVTAGIGKVSSIEQYALKEIAPKDGRCYVYMVAESDASFVNIEIHNGTATATCYISDRGIEMNGSAQINVLNLGVIPNDYSRETAIQNDSIIQSVLDRVNDGIILYFPKGTYYTRQGYHIAKDNVIIKGDGAELTTFTALSWNISNPDSGHPTIFYNDYDNANEPISNVQLMDFSIDKAGKGIFFSKLINCTFRNLFIKNTDESGLGCDHFKGGIIDGVRCSNCGKKGDLSAAAYGCSGIGIGAGWFNDGFESLSVSNCHCNDCKQYGLFFEAQPSIDGHPSKRPVGLSVVGCTAKGNRTGIGICGYEGASVIGCTAFNNHHAGFSFDNGTLGKDPVAPLDTRAVKFIACSAYSNGASIQNDYPEYNGQKNGYGFYISSKYDNIEIVSCNISSNIKSGIVFVDGIKMLNITGGEIADNSEYGIELNGECRFFNICPMIVRNSQHGIHISNSIYQGFINNSVIANNDVGIYKSVDANLYDVHIGQIVYVGNTKDANL